MANLNYYYSTMDAGKTLDLLSKAYRYESNGYKILALKPKEDIKGGEYIVTRIGLKRKCDFLIEKNKSVITLLKDNLDGVKKIYVDEAELLSEEQIDDLNYISKFYDIEVNCYGLRDNFKMKQFSGSRRLFEIADYLYPSFGICKCGQEAPFVARKYEGEYEIDGEEVVIDGQNKKYEYESMCGLCYLKKVKKLTKEKIISYNKE